MLLVLTAILLIKTVNCLYCFEGNNCDENGCDRCEGEACVRVARPTRNSIYISDRPVTRSSTFFDHIVPTKELDFHGPQSQVAMTCLPSTGLFGLEPEGCRTDPINQLRTCICYKNDYCNHATQSQFHWLNLILLPILIRYIV